jgi:hypothetical protein
MAAIMPGTLPWRSNTARETRQLAEPSSPSTRDDYGRASGNPKCQQCVVHCGHEPSAVDHTFSSFGLVGTIKAIVFKKYANPGATKSRAEEARKPHCPLARLVELGFANDVKQKAGAA